MISDSVLSADGGSSMTLEVVPGSAVDSQSSEDDRAGLCRGLILGMKIPSGNPEESGELLRPDPETLLERGRDDRDRSARELAD